MKTKKNIRQNILQRSLKAKMLFYFLLTFLIVLVTTGIIILTNVSSVVVDLNNKLTEQVVLARADEIGKYIQGIIYDVKTMSESNVITSGDIDAIKNDIETRESALRSDFVRTLYAELDGGYYSSTGATGNIADRDYFKKIVSEGADYAISNPVVSTTTGETVFIVAYPVKNANGEMIGVFGATILMDTFNEVITSIQIGDSGIPWIVDNTGLIIAHPNENIRLSLYATDSTEAGFEGLDGIGTKMISGESGTDEYNSNGEQYYAIYAPIPATPNWSLAYSISGTEMMAPVNNLTIVIAIIFAIGLLLVAALTYVISTSIVKPIKTAAELANSLASGKLDQPIMIKSKDEIGLLSQVLDTEVRHAFKSIEQARKVSDKQAKYQSDEVEKLLVNLERLAQGSLLCDIDVASGDEDTEELCQLYKKISKNMHAAIDAINGYIKETSDVLGEMSTGNLTMEISSDYKGDFRALKDSINGIMYALNKTMSGINSSADQVAAGTQQVSNGSQEISQGATEQASSIEELTSTASEIAEQTRQNAENASRANELTLNAKNNAARGNEQMKAMQQAMTDINESSANISKIIKVIDDIAFQTNILALNAAVEAARAGVHGKGFAVVAEEVRNLAAKSADAAKQTTDLIEGSIRKTEAGTKIADDTAEALAGIVDGVNKAVELVGNIASASNEQASAIAQINNGIEQMNQVVQTNSATSEEQAAAAEELSSQAEMLKNMVGQFQLKSENAGIERIEAKQPELKAAKETVQEKPKIHLNDADFGKY